MVPSEASCFGILRLNRAAANSCSNLTMVLVLAPINDTGSTTYIPLCEELAKAYTEVHREAHISLEKNFDVSSM